TDCSGFVMSVYSAFGVGLPHSSSADRGVGYAVSTSDMQPGDIVCYSGHVGIYAGNGTIVHAANESLGITYSNVYYSNILAVRRIF
ncbi:MAG: C40 family peptidase, partial [Lachnospiraceae bacterium]|nr:C40 family peptidase [Lachnospiraceae bacterium]